MEDGPRYTPKVVVIGDGDALVACPCGALNVVRSGVAFQCPCGWAVLMTTADGRIEFEAQSRA
jgi:hypothetical protein